MTRFRTAAAAAVLALAAVAAPATAAELLVNGSFEDIGSASPEGWGGYTFYAGGPYSITGWTTAAGSVDVTKTGSFWGPAYDGQNSIDINGWSAGTLSQTFDTVAGQKYQVSFAYGRNVAGAPDPATATVSAGGQIFNIIAPNDGTFGSGYNMAWKTGGFSFVGDGSPTTLSLTATVPGNGGVFFDQISVQSVGGAGGVPEPATWALMIGGFGLVGAQLRRRRTVLA